MNGGQRAKRRRELACREQNWLCYYCGLKMTKPRQRQHKGCSHRDDEATLEHLDDRFDPARGTRRGEIRRVAACRKCNQDRAKARLIENAKEQRKRSRTGHDR